MDAECKELLKENIYPRFLNYGDLFQLLSRMEFNNEGMEFFYEVPKEPYWEKHHFPNDPMMPGGLISEIGHQAGALAYILSKGKTNGSMIRFVLTGVQAKYVRPVRPGDKIVVIITEISENSLKRSTEVVIKMKGFLINLVDHSRKLCLEQTTIGAKLQEEVML